jgi:cation diffusion facilitator CzcD-associated flavoprotein CzcO
MATGLCSKTYIPDIDTSAFEGMILHTKGLQKCHDGLVSEKIKSVIVVGSHKSSVEAGAMCKGKKDCPLAGQGKRCWPSHIP